MEDHVVDVKKEEGTSIKEAVKTDDDVVPYVSHSANIYSTPF